MSRHPQLGKVLLVLMGTATTLVLLSSMLLIARTANAQHGQTLAIHQATTLATDTPTSAPSATMQATATDTVPVPTDTPAVTATPTPLSAPTVIPTATLPTVSVLSVSPASEHVICDNHHWQGIIITNVGSYGVGWNTLSSDARFTVNPSGSLSSGNSILPPGQSDGTDPDGLAPAGTVFTVSVFEIDNTGTLGPLAGVTTFYCQ